MIQNYEKIHVLEGLLALKRSGLHEAVKILNVAAQEFKSEDIIDSDELDYTYLLYTQPEFDIDNESISVSDLDFDDCESD